MPITVESAERHVQYWSDKVACNLWPKYLFHHCHVTVAAMILRQGKLVCRNSQPALLHDVANQAAIAANPHAGEYARLYFRPKNHFHLKTEGIKLRHDNYRDRNHMSIPVALLFDLKSVLQLPGVGFSSGKLAHADAIPGFDQDAFSKIEFADVYHDAPPGARQAVVNERRMAEVAVPKELSLEHLRFVVCRSNYDELTLRNLAGDVSNEYLRRIRVPSILTNFFFARGIFLQNIEFRDLDIYLKVFPGTNYRPGTKIRCQIEQLIGAQVKYRADFERELNNQGVRVGKFGNFPNSSWRIFLEEVLAFEGYIPAATSELVTV